MQQFRFSDNNFNYSQHSTLLENNVPTDFTIHFPNNRLDIHRRVLEAFSSLFREIPPDCFNIRSCLFRTKLDFDIVKVIVSFCYEGECLVDSKDLRRLCHQSKALGMTTLHKMVHQKRQRQSRREQRGTEIRPRSPFGEPRKEWNHQEIKALLKVLLKDKKRRTKRTGVNLAQVLQLKGMERSTAAIARMKNRIEVAFGKLEDGFDEQRWEPYL